ncbi:acyl-CoA dehydrogenase [Sphingomonas profundi]|uniref:acyl-CoA dehydrogenase n=1 Tax=Alterirhizorhabdus profundi TaxID=2681549 RepID=UPI0012E7A83F|nr:acyl-CoA dehydrogenase [Sphingomonas profundi]
MTYTPPLAEQGFVLETVADLPGLAALPPFADATADMVEAILAEGGRFAAEAFAPLNRIGDTEGARWSADGVTLPAGFREAYAAYVANGWGAVGADPAYGGQGLPFVLATAVQEQLTSANMAFSLCMMLTQGAISAISAHGSEEQRALYLSRLISGEWSGTMNLTEPQAGSDVGALRTTATPAGDGTYRISGSKIFITWGDHDLAGNVVHLVLARLPGAPAGTKGISLFVVPKFLPGADGEPGARNDLRCASIEHKLGIHASPTCTMSYGDEGKCVGWLVGPEHGGMRAMFTMMNHARIGVGLQGLAVAERAYQGALGYARERVQGGPIITHPDVRRMLMTMRALTQSARALTYYNAAAVDRAHAEPDEGARRAAQALADLLTPIGKAWGTDVGVDVASLGIQIFGGMGYIEETGAAQHLRDARIAPIYEGTNGIQALDLVGRKLRLENGEPVRRLIGEIAAFGAAGGDGRLAPIRREVARAAATLEEATAAIVADGQRDAAAGATPYLRLFALVLGAWLLGRQAEVAVARLDAGEGDAAFLEAKIATAAFFAAQILPQVDGLLPAVRADATLLFALDEAQLAA